MEVNMNFEFTADQVNAITLLGCSLISIGISALFFMLQDSNGLFARFGFLLMFIYGIGAVGSFVLSLLIWYVPACVFSIFVVCIFIIKFIIKKYRNNKFF